jgi:hypothetical protein
MVDVEQRALRTLEQQAVAATLASASSAGTSATIGATARCERQRVVVTWSGSSACAPK